MDVSRTEEELLAGMKQKTRYNIRLSKRKGIQVRRGSKADLPLLYNMYAETSVRDGFVIRPEQYYLDLWNLFIESGMATPLIAEFEGGGDRRYGFGFTLREEPGICMGCPELYIVRKCRTI